MTALRNKKTTKPAATAQAKKPDAKATPQQPNSNKPPQSSANAGKVASTPAQPAVNLDEKPLSVEERDNLIRQINSLTAQQSEGIISIV